MFIETKLVWVEGLALMEQIMEWDAVGVGFEETSSLTARITTMEYGNRRYS
jgi:hypothetical protein